MQTYIEYLRGKVEDNQTINHHGKELKVENGKVVDMSEVGGGDSTMTPVEPFDSKKKADLVSTDEKIQREALKEYYQRWSKKLL